MKTLLRAAPPRDRMAARARAMWGASIESPVAFNAKYAFTVALISKAPPWNNGQPPCSPWIARRYSGDAPLFRAVDRAEIMLQQDVFRRDRRIGLELERPMAVGALQLEQGARGVLDRRVEPFRAGRPLS